MTSTNRSLSQRFVAASVGALVAVAVLGACSSDSKSSSSTGGADTTVAPESITVDDATVTAGFTRLPATIASAIAAIGTPDAKAKLEEIEAEWASFEGTVRNNEAALYLEIEDQLTPLQRQIEAGDAAAASATATTLAGLFAQYLAKHP